MSSKGEITRQKIVDNTLQLFTVKGYYHTSINDIIVATGITKGGLYGHFKSKEEIWYAAYDRAVVIWKSLVFKNSRQFLDPLERIEDTILCDMRDYLGADVFEGGCFFLIMFIELAGQNPEMSEHIEKGFTRFADLYYHWLVEAGQAGMLKSGLDLREIANFLVIAVNGAGTMYSATKNASIWKETITQLNFYLKQLKLR
ncbi:MAG: TetR/AcrR family transcriptional regulator [Proteobacteria bacterium]|nr:TetR/AcrR family transcriptional regulator [Pseudomonadota bacterium]